MGESITRDPYHNDTIRGPVGRFNLTFIPVPLTFPQLVRNLPNILGNVQEEIELAFENELGLEGHGAFFACSTTGADILPEWKEVRFPPALKRIVARVSNRVFVGPPLCKS